MRWLADECVDAALVDQLRTGGHDVDYMIEIAAGASDLEAIERAQREGRLLLTSSSSGGCGPYRASCCCGSTPNGETSSGFGWKLQ